MSDFSFQYALLPHSCFPSCAVNHDNELILLRPLLPDGKLTLDYSTLFTGNCSIFNCCCGCNGCRQKIRGFDTLPVIFQEYYMENDGVPGTILALLRQLPDFKRHLFPKLRNDGCRWLS